MKTQNVNNKLKFDKHSLVELNDAQLHDLDGASTAVCVTIGVTIGVSISIVTRKAVVENRFQ